MLRPDVPARTIPPVTVALSFRTGNGHERVDADRGVHRHPGPGGAPAPG